MKEPLTLGVEVAISGTDGITSWYFVFTRFMYGNPGRSCWYRKPNGVPISWEGICSLGEPKEIDNGDTGS